MKQFILVLVVMCSALSSWAGQPSRVGTWCQKFDDFTTYFIIKADDSARMMTIGNEANEVAQDEKGYISFGANQHQVYLDGQNIGVNEIKVFSFLGIKYLRLEFTNGSHQTYKKCNVRITVGQIPVT